MNEFSITPALQHAMRGWLQKIEDRLHDLAYFGLDVSDAFKSELASMRARVEHATLHGADEGRGYFVGTRHDRRDDAPFPSRADVEWQHLNDELDACEAAGVSHPDLPACDLCKDVIPRGLLRRCQDCGGDFCGGHCLPCERCGAGVCADCDPEHDCAGES
jgi:hypothetical protein